LAREETAAPAAAPRPRGVDGAVFAAEKNSSEAGVVADSMLTHEQRIECGARRGSACSFIGGVYSSLGNEYQGRKGGTYAEHIQRVLRFPFRNIARKSPGIFNPTNFDADAWVRRRNKPAWAISSSLRNITTALRCGRPKVNDYNVMDATPWHPTDEGPERGV